MKKLLFCMLMAAGFLAGCGGAEDMSSPPAETPAATDTNAATAVEPEAE